MQFDIKANATAFSMMLVAACSGTPRTAETATVSAVPPQHEHKSFAAADNTPAASPAAAPAATAVPADKVDANLVKAGYSVLKHRDQILYCRREIITGQRIETRICLTAAQIQDEKHEVSKAKDLLNHPSFNCQGHACND
jgi:hypothetical protein